MKMARIEPLLDRVRSLAELASTVPTPDVGEDEHLARDTAIRPDAQGGRTPDRPLCPSRGTFRTGSLSPILQGRMLLTLSGFLTGLLRGLGLLGLALAVGGVVWGLVVLRAPRRGDLPPRTVRRCLDLVGLGAVSLALAQKATLLLEIYVLEATLGRSPLAELLATPHFLAGI